MSFIIKCTPIKKRFFYIDNLNNDEQVWVYNDEYEELSDEVSRLNQSIRKIEKNMDTIC